MNFLFVCLYPAWVAPFEFIDIDWLDNEQFLAPPLEQGERRPAVRLMEAKFGPLSVKVKEQIEELSPEALAKLQLDLLEARNLEELRRDD